MIHGTVSPRIVRRHVRGRSADARIAAVEALVRATIGRASEFVELPWSADVVSFGESAERIWQVAGIAPLGSLDQFALLRCRTAAELLARLVEETQAADAGFTAGWADDRQDDGDFL